MAAARKGDGLRREGELASGDRARAPQRGSRAPWSRLAREGASIAAAVAIAALVLYALGIGCPIKFFSGVSCPGCGLTRAWLEALQLHFDVAFAYHPLFWAVPVAGALVLLWTYRGSRVALAFTVVLIAAFLGLWVLRMAVQGDLELFCTAAGAGDVVNVSAPGWMSLLPHGA